MWAIQPWLGLSSLDVTLVVCGLEARAHESLLASVPRERNSVLTPFSE